MKVVTTNSLTKSVSFWLCVGLFIYFSGNFFVILFSNYSKNPALNIQFKIIYSIVVICKDIILAFAWFAHERIETDADTIKFPNGLGLDDDLPFTKTNNA
jgi:Na+-transporting NADH:ubiquinone oxidoreductase subunit NqrD